MVIVGSTWGQPAPPYLCLPPAGQLFLGPFTRLANEVTRHLENILQEVFAHGVREPLDVAAQVEIESNI